MISTVFACGLFTSGVLYLLLFNQVCQRLLKFCFELFFARTFGFRLKKVFFILKGGLCHGQRRFSSVFLFFFCAWGRSKGNYRWSFILIPQGGADLPLDT